MKGRELEGEEVGGVEGRGGKKGRKEGGAGRKEGDGRRRTSTKGSRVRIECHLE